MPQHGNLATHTYMYPRASLGGAVVPQQWFLIDEIKYRRSSVSSNISEATFIATGDVADVIFAHGAFSVVSLIYAAKFTNRVYKFCGLNSRKQSAF